MPITIPTLVAEDVMKRDVITLGDSWDVREALRIFREKEITGAPVADGKGDLVGVLSTTDIARLHDAPARAGGAADSDFYRTTAPFGAPQEGAIDRLAGVKVRDVMTPVVIDADVKTPVEKLAAIMVDLRVHRVIVTERGKLAGIVSSLDLLRILRDGTSRR
jgi:CBS-domain-containing membrane protein